MKDLSLQNSKVWKGFNDYYNSHHCVNLENKIFTKNDYDGSKKTLIKGETYVSAEETLDMIINEKYKVSLLCTPEDLESLALGYLICEGLISDRTQFEFAELIDETIMVYIKNDPITQKCFSEELEIRSSGCVGVKQQYNNLDLKIRQDIEFPLEAFFKAHENMTKSSKYWKLTGGTHMSALSDGSGEIRYFSEDIGRHNSIDKVVGKCLMDDNDLSDYFLVTSGRISAATIVKCARAGITTVSSVSAALEQAISLGRKFKMTVIGFNRKPEINFYVNNHVI